MKKYTFLGSLFLLFNLAALAQTDSSYSLKRCIDYALLNQTSIRNAESDLGIAKAKVGEIRAIGLPQVNGAASVIDNPNLRRLFFVANPSNPFTQNIPGVQPGDVIASPNLFQLRSSGDASATISQLLFDGSYIVGLQAAGTYRQLAEKNIYASKIQTVESVTKAYYMVLINQERIALLATNVSRLDSMLKQTRAQYAAGFVEKIDADRLEVTYNNLYTDMQKFENLLGLSMVILHFQMGMPLDSAMVLTDKLADLNFDTTETALPTKFDFSKRVDYAALETQRKLQIYERKNVFAGYLPRLSAFATGGYTRQDKHVSNVFGNQWFNYSMLGVNLSVPIFDGLSKHYKAQQTKLNLVKTDNNLSALRNLIGLQIMQSNISLKNSLQTLASQKRNLELAQEVLRVTKIKYQAGVGSNIEVVNAEASFKEAQTNYFAALFDAVVAKVDLQKATGTLYTE
ncbi:MAG: TolC family protein [Cytophagaceae bacterium]